MPVGVQPTREQIDQELTAAAQSLRALGNHLLSMVLRYGKLGPTGLMNLQAVTPGKLPYTADEAAEVLRLVGYFADFTRMYGGVAVPPLPFNYSDAFAEIETDG
jgi:hypothetical protein